MKQDIKYYTQTEIADLLGVSKATVSRYLKKNNVTGNKKNNSKIYPETILKQLKKELKPNNKGNKEHISTIQLLQEQITQLKDENKTLKEQLKIKDQQIETASRLADQAQKLNILDKPELKTPQSEKKHWWNIKKD